MHGFFERLDVGFRSAQVRDAGFAVTPRDEKRLRDRKDTPRGVERRRLVAHGDERLEDHHGAFFVDVLKVARGVV